MPVAAAIAGAAIIGGGASVISANKAAKAQTKAADQAVAEQRRQSEQARADQEPWRLVGQGAVGKLAAAYGVGANGESITPDRTGFETSPGYDFRLSEGVKAAERSAAARGQLASGATMKAVQRYGEGLASSEWENYTGHLAQLAGIGQQATNATQQAGQNAANNISSAYMGAGNARASSYMNAGAAINNAAQNLASVYAYNAGGGFKPPTFPTVKY